MADIYLLRELDSEWWEVGGTFPTFEEALAAGEARDDNDWDILRLEVGRVGGGELMTWAKKSPPKPSIGNGA